MTDGMRKQKSVQKRGKNAIELQTLLMVLRFHCTCMRVASEDIHVNDD